MFGITFFVVQHPCGPAARSAEIGFAQFGVV